MKNKKLSQFTLLSRTLTKEAAFIKGLKIALRERGVTIRSSHCAEFLEEGEKMKISYFRALLGTERNGRRPASSLAPMEIFLASNRISVFYFLFFGAPNCLYVCQLVFVFAWMIE